MALPSHFPMKVANGKTVDVPSVGFGTWAAGETTWCETATLTALRSGYRHLDCAWRYGVDGAVGAAIRRSEIPRAQIFVTTKFWPQFAAPANVGVCLDRVLDQMGLEYVDLYLVHWPVATVPGEELGEAVVDEGSGREALDLGCCPRDVAGRLGAEGSFLPTWHAMQALVASGKCRAIGVSNFSITQLDEILSSYPSDSTSSTSSSASAPTKTNPNIPLSCNQIEAHPYLPNGPLLAYMRKHSILATAYSPFAGQAAFPSPWLTQPSDPRPLLLEHPVVQSLAQKNKMGVGQLLQSWAVQKGTIPLGKSQDEARIRANLDVRRLGEEDVRALDALEVPDGKGRTIDYGPFWGVEFFV